VASTHASFVFPDATLYHGADEGEGESLTVCERRPIAAGQLSKHSTFHFGELLVRQSVSLEWQLGHAASAR
jgi:hypothetical protein